MQVGEVVDRDHNVPFDDLPTVLEEGTSEAIRPRRFVTWEIPDCPLNRFLSEGSPKLRKVTWRDWNITPINVNAARWTPFCYLEEVVLDDGLLVIMISDPSTIVLEAVNEILSSSTIDAEMKKMGVGISNFEVGDSRTLPFSGTLKHR